MEHIGDAESWDDAFATARDLLLKGQLTAISMMPQSEFERGGYSGGTVLEEFAASMGGTTGVLNDQEFMAPLLNPNATSFSLHHGEIGMAHPYVPSGKGWLLIIVHNDEKP